MNQTQRLIVALGGALLFASAVCAPYNWVNVAPDASDRDPRDAGLHMIFSPPRTNVYGYEASVDFSRLGYYWATVVVATFGLAFAFRDGKK